MQVTPSSEPTRKAFPLLDLTDRIAKAMRIGSGVLLIFIMTVTLVDVVARTIFTATGGALDVTFTGAVELVSYGMLAMVLLAFPYGVDKGQVIVDLFTDNFSRQTKMIMEAVYMLGFTALSTGMAIRFFEVAGRMKRSGESSQDLLIPLHVVYSFASCALAFLALRCILLTIDYLISGAKRP
ncbi:MAG: TRAP transporter small permease subunit [Thalassospira sp.]|uniref:TRAP transporter small permease subunit n=1 Tax=Thalassospira sp. TaxID=1912094 RepID=UPI0032EF3663|tara:strand:+ start:47064 stop:47609 length:546 start_codon:yes stop_codon:yes gene_type:complete